MNEDFTLINILYGLSALAIYIAITMAFRYGMLKIWNNIQKKWIETKYLLSKNKPKKRQN